MTDKLIYILQSEHGGSMCTFTNLEYVEATLRAAYATKNGFVKIIAMDDEEIPPTSWIATVTYTTGDKIRKDGFEIWQIPLYDRVIQLNLWHLCEVPEGTWPPNEEIF